MASLQELSRALQSLAESRASAKLSFYYVYTDGIPMRAGSVLVDHGVSAYVRPSTARAAGGDRCHSRVEAGQGRFAAEPVRRSMRFWLLGFGLIARAAVKVRKLLA